MDPFVNFRNSEKIAVVYLEESLTFFELKQRSFCLSRKLLSQGVKKGDIIPILHQRGMEPIIALFGVWLAGGVPTIIDTTYPKERINKILLECKSDFFIDEKWYQKIEFKDIAFDGKVFSDLKTPMLFFTSGSTGKPKGVMLPESSVKYSAKNLNHFYEENDIFLCTVSFSFVVFITTFLSPLMDGHTVHILDNEARKDVNLMAEYIKANKITVSFVAPAIAPAFLKIADGALRMLFTASERVRNVYSEKTKCYCLYGATEVSGIVTWFEIDRLYSSTPIGYPTEGCKVYLLDDNLTPVELGKQGEIYISGPVALCYLNLPELTKERFINNPFSENENDKILFKTNDYGRLLENGACEYIERKDFMLKIRGNRVEPAEVETAILASAPISRALVVGFENHLGDTILQACYVADTKIDKKLLIEELSKKLPVYMMPSFYEQLDAIPVNANGKMDRSQIKPLNLNQGEYVAPTNERERLICATFENAFNLDLVGVNDDFVLLGGTSLTAVHIVALLPENFNISAADILTLRTPWAIAQSQASVLPIMSERDYWNINSYELHCIDFYKEDAGRYGLKLNFPFILEGALDANRLEKAIGILFKRHRIMRAAYVQVKSGEYMRTFTDVPKHCLKVIEAEESDILRIFEEQDEPFILSEGNLCRFLLFKVSQHKHILWLSVFHGIIDGPSIQFLFEELSDIYIGKIKSDALVRPDSFDFYEWYRESQQYTEEMVFYDKMFEGGLKINPLPWYDGTKCLPNPIDTVLSYDFDERSLLKAAKQLGVSAFSPIIVAVALMIGEVCNKTDVTISLTMNMRFKFSVLAKTIGLYAVIVPMRVQWNKEDDLNSMVKKTDIILSQIQSHMSYGGQDWLKAALKDVYFDYMPLPNLNYRQDIGLPQFADLDVGYFLNPNEGTAEVVNSMLGVFVQCEDALKTVFKFPLNGCSKEVAVKMNENFVSVLETFIKENI